MADLTPESEHLVAVPAALLAAFRAVLAEPEPDRVSLTTARLVVRLVTTDPVSGDLVLGVKLHRNLDLDDQ